MNPRLSIVIPTHNRREAVIRLLRALESQQPIEGGVEVYVVCDGCTDHTTAAVAALREPFPVVVVEQPASGPAEARNRGASRAAGDILLFLDDDVEPMPGMLRAHDAFHAQVANGIAVGDLPPAMNRGGYFPMIVRGWLQGMFDGARERGHRYNYRDVLSGHLSIRRELFEALGGFDASLRVHEDYELGYRAIEAGLMVRFLPTAVARHHDCTDLSKLLRRKFEEGVADVQLCKKHPAFCHALPLRRRPERGRVGRLLYWLAWRQPRIGDALAKGLRATLCGYEVLRLRFRWRARLEDVIDYWYWRGVAKVLGRPDCLEALRSVATPGAPELVLDLALGVTAAAERLERQRPRSVQLVYQREPVGVVNAEPGAERLRGAHLSRIIARDFAWEYVRAASHAGAIPAVLLSLSGPELELLLHTVTPHDRGEVVAA